MVRFWVMGLVLSEVSFGDWVPVWDILRFRVHC